MKKRYQIFGFLMLALAFMALNAGAQVRYVDVLPGVGTLNDAINGDTLETGERTDLNTVYRLQRGLEAYYGLTGRIENSGFPLTIMAADGDGPRPFLQPRVVGDASDGAFRPRANLTLKGLHVTGVDELGGQTQRMIRASADDISVRVDDCWFEKEAFTLIFRRPATATAQVGTDPDSLQPLPEQETLAALAPPGTQYPRVALIALGPARTLIPPLLKVRLRITAVTSGPP